MRNLVLVAAVFAAMVASWVMVHRPTGAEAPPARAEVIQPF
jgi:hypothetical protein